MTESWSLGHGAKSFNTVLGARDAKVGVHTVVAATPRPLTLPRAGSAPGTAALTCLTCQATSSVRVDGVTVSEH